MNEANPKLIEHNLKLRAMNARLKLSEIGLKYGSILLKKHPEINTDEGRVKLYKVAHGHKADETITMWLEELVKQYSAAVA